MKYFIGCRFSADMYHRLLRTHNASFSNMAMPLNVCGLPGRWV